VLKARKRTFWSQEELAIAGDEELMARWAGFSPVTGCSHEVD